MESTAVTDYNARYVYKNKIVSLTDLREPDQGAPVIGSLLIDGKNIFRRVNYATPILFHEDHMFLPMARHKETPITFSVCAINLQTYEISAHSETYPRIILREVRKNWIIFSTSEHPHSHEYVDLYWVR